MADIIRTARKTKKRPCPSCKKRVKAGEKYVVRIRHCRKGESKDFTMKGKGPMKRFEVHADGECREEWQAQFNNVALYPMKGTGSQEKQGV